MSDGDDLNLRLTHALDEALAELEGTGTLDRAAWLPTPPREGEELPGLPDALHLLHGVARHWIATEATPHVQGMATGPFPGDTPSDSAEPAPPPERVGRYRVVGRVGAGGMGAV